MSQQVTVGDKGPSKTILSSPFLGIKIKKTVPTIPTDEFCRQQLHRGGEIPDPSILYKPGAAMARSQFDRIGPNIDVTENTLCSCFGLTITRWREPDLRVDEIETLIGTAEDYYRDKAKAKGRELALEDSYVDISETTMCSCFGVTLKKWITTFRVKRPAGDTRQNLANLNMALQMAAATPAKLEPIPAGGYQEHKEKLPKPTEIVFRYGGPQETYIQIPEMARRGVKGIDHREWLVTKPLVDMAQLEYVQKNNRIAIDQMRWWTGRRPVHQSGLNNPYTQRMYDMATIRAQKISEASRSRSRSPFSPRRRPTSRNATPDPSEEDSPDSQPRPASSRAVTPEPR